MAPAPGGVPERPKGTGCKPVGSAYRGSNPLSPITRLPRLRRGSSDADAAGRVRQATRVSHLDFARELVERDDRIAAALATLRALEADVEELRTHAEGAIRF